MNSKALSIPGKKKPDSRVRRFLIAAGTAACLLNGCVSLPAPKTAAVKTGTGRFPAFPEASASVKTSMDKDGKPVFEVPEIEIFSDRRKEGARFAESMRAPLSVLVAVLAQENAVRRDPKTNPVVLRASVKTAADIGAAFRQAMQSSDPKTVAEGYLSNRKLLSNYYKASGGWVLVLSESICFANRIPGNRYADARLGQLLLALPLIAHVMQSSKPWSPGAWRGQVGRILDCMRGIDGSLSFVGSTVGLWTTARHPLSQKTLEELFDALRDGIRPYKEYPLPSTHGSRGSPGPS